MRLMFLRIALTAGILWQMSACTTKVYFTTAMRHMLEQKKVELTRLQFYVDRDVELIRVVHSSQAATNAGKVRMENGKYINIIDLPKGTSGVCTKADSGSVNISFEVGEGRFLPFVAEQKTSGDRFYVLKTQGDSSKVDYAGNRYTARTFSQYEQSVGRGTQARLMVKKSQINKMTVERRKMSGRRVE